jgi:mRNA-degrading endonuclease RelE of RelBE toxin-antitoxin system
MESDRLPIRVFPSDRFRKDIKKLSKRYRSVREDIEPLIARLEAGETPGDRIAENKYSVYKVRVKNGDIKKGKSGGYRVIYYIQTESIILLVTIYSKSDLANIGTEEITAIINEFDLDRRVDQ